MVWMVSLVSQVQVSVSDVENSATIKNVFSFDLNYRLIRCVVFNAKCILNELTVDFHWVFIGIPLDSQQI